MPGPTIGAPTALPNDSRSSISRSTRGVSQAVNATHVSARRAAGPPRADTAGYDQVDMLVTSIDAVYLSKRGTKSV